MDIIKRHGYIRGDSKDASSGLASGPNPVGAIIYSKILSNLQEMNGKK